MNVSDLISDILDHDVRILMLGHVPENPALFFTQCEQTFGTGGQGCFTKLNHQKINANLVVALQELREVVIDSLRNAKDDQPSRLPAGLPPNTDNERGPVQS